MEICRICKPKIYGGVNLTNNEMEILKLPPKFAIYKKSSELVLKSQFEKAITCLRWNVKQETGEKEQSYPRESVFDHEENNFDFRFMKANTLPFNKRVYMPPYADETTKARITHTREEIEKLIEQHVASKKNKNFSNLTKEQSTKLT